jgi:hypothetical protein
MRCFRHGKGHDHQRRKPRNRPRDRRHLRIRNAELPQLAQRHRGAEHPACVPSPRPPPLHEQHVPSRRRNSRRKRSARRATPNDQDLDIHHDAGTARTA